MDKMEKRDGGAAFGSYDRNPWDISPYSAPTLGGPFGKYNLKIYLLFQKIIDFKHIIQANNKQKKLIIFWNNRL